MRSVVRRGSLRPTLATALLLLLIAVIGTAMPFPLFFPLREVLEPQVPPLIQIVRPYVASLAVLGSRGAVLLTGALAAVLDWEPAMPPSVDSWLLAAQRIGALSGLVVAALVPAWVLVVWARRPVMPGNTHPAPLRNVPLAIAVIWTIVVSRPLVGLVGAAVFPTDTWLMLPSAAVGPGVEPPPPARWCARQLHPSMFACEAQRMASLARKDETTAEGFAYAGARCISAADVAHPRCEPPTAAVPPAERAPATN